ncbi:MAG: hypothetical protein JW818_09770 [Pirellulales bacterium]|nr:hypothetical protein [Pirellulales bacterium]
MTENKTSPRDTFRNMMAIAVAIGLLCVPALIIRISYEIALVGAVPAIEQLRADINDISGVSSEDAIGQATQWNQRIRTLQAYNAQWWGNPFIPDAWNDIELIPIPKMPPTSELHQPPVKVSLAQ